MDPQEPPVAVGALWTGLELDQCHPTGNHHIYTSNSRGTEPGTNLPIMYTFAFHLQINDVCMCVCIVWVCGCVCSYLIVFYRIEPGSYGLVCLFLFIIVSVTDLQYILCT